MFYFTDYGGQYSSDYIGTFSILAQCILYLLHFAKAGLYIKYFGVY